MRQELITLVCKLECRIREIHRLRTALRVSWDKGIIQLAELSLPAPSVMRGPFSSGFLDSKDFQVDND